MFQSLGICWVNHGVAVLCFEGKWIVCLHDGWGPQNDCLVDWFLHVPSVLLFCPFLFGHFQRGVKPDGSNLAHVLVNHWLKKSTPPLPSMCRICWNGLSSFITFDFSSRHLVQFLSSFRFSVKLRFPWGTAFKFTLPFLLLASGCTQINLHDMSGIQKRGPIIL